jgi:hypothetical protein
MTTEAAQWYGLHLMLMRGRWGFCWNCKIKSCGSMREVTPGNWSLKKDGTMLGISSSFPNTVLGAKRVQVKDPSCKSTSFSNQWSWMMAGKDPQTLLRGQTHVTWYRDEHELFPRPYVQVIG